MAENPDSHDHVLPKTTKNFCAASISTGNCTGTCVAQKSTRSSFAALNYFFSPGTTLKLIKLSCNAASSTANVCDNVWQIAGSAVKGLAKKQQTSSIAKSANRQTISAFCMNFEKCHFVLEALHRFVQITHQLVPSL